MDGSLDWVFEHQRALSFLPINGVRYNIPPLSLTLLPPHDVPYNIKWQLEAKLSDWIWRLWRITPGSSQILKQFNYLHLTKSWRGAIEAVSFARKVHRPSIPEMFRDLDKQNSHKLLILLLSCFLSIPKGWRGEGTPKLSQTKVIFFRQKETNRGLYILLLSNWKFRISRPSVLWPRQGKRHKKH